ncbi:MAG: nitrogenase component 1 [Eubacteriales bacterium]|nr:nitrogenase component 1 [Eubacteriales bacterium]
MKEFTECRRTTMEVCDYLEKTIVSSEEEKKFTPQGLKCVLARERGFKGFSVRMLLIPESIHVVISPPACGRHGDYNVLMAGIKGRFFRIRLSEKDIVSGGAENSICKELFELLDSMETKPKAVTLCITCIDGVLCTDYRLIGKRLKERYGVRFGIARMFPFLANSVKTHGDLLMESMYELLEVPEDRTVRKAVNLVGHLDATKENTDFYIVLNKAGYDVQEIHACNTIKDYDKLGEACLNVVLNKNMVSAAEVMKTKYGIPYVEFIECMNPEQIKKNYEAVEDALGVKLEYEEYYQEACRKVSEVYEKVKNKSFALGGEVDYNPVKFAYDWCQTGFPLKYFLVNRIKKEDLEYYKWIRDYAPDTYLYLATDTSMMKFIADPDPVEFVAGVQFSLVQQLGNVSSLELGEEPYDFKTLIEELDKIKASVESAEMNSAEKTANQDSENKIFARDWSTYREM